MWFASRSASLKARAAALFRGPPLGPLSMSFAAIAITLPSAVVTGFEEHSPSGVADRFARFDSAVSALRGGYEIVVPMIESWVIDDGNGAPVSPEAVVERLRARVFAGQRETWLSSSSGRLLAFVTNTKRAAVSLLDGEGDAGEHAVDPSAAGSSEGFVLSNGQYDEYPDEDTVPLEEAFRIVEHIVSQGSWPPDARWVVDR